MSFVPVPVPVSISGRRPASHRAPRGGARALTRTRGATVAKHRAEPQRRRGGLRALATGTIAAGLMAAPALTSPASAHPSYTVQPGDTLSSIARKVGSSWQELYAANRDVISDPSLIYVGQTLQTGTDGSASSGDEGSVGQAGGFEQQLLAEASRLAGVPYVYGGTTPSGFDCSGFTSYVFAQVGKIIPRTSSAQAAAAMPVSAGDLRVGDLIFYSPGGSVSHVAIYAGNGMVWEAPGSGGQVRYAPIWDVSRSYGRF